MQKLLEALTATINVSIRFSWLALLIASVPSGIASLIAPDGRRRQYLIAGLLGGIAGESCGVGSLFLGLWLSCLKEPQPCNTAQGDMGLIVTFPVGSILGSLLAIGWTWLTLKIPAGNPWSSVCSYSGPDRVRNWAYAIASQIVFWILLTWLFARLMS